MLQSRAILTIRLVHRYMLRKMYWTWILCLVCEKLSYLGKYCVLMEIKIQFTPPLLKTHSQRRTLSSNRTSWELVLRGLILFLNGPTLASFCLFSFFSNTNFTEKLQTSAGLELGVEGELADHLTPTTALEADFTTTRLNEANLTIKAPGFRP